MTGPVYGGKGTVGKNLRGLRKDWGVTQEEWAFLLGVHPMTISKWEREQAIPTAFQLDMLQVLQDVTPTHREQWSQKRAGAKAGLRKAAALYGKATHDPLQRADFWRAVFAMNYQGSMIRWRI